MRSVVYLSTYKLFALQQRIANELPCPDGHCHDGDWRVKVATGYSSMILGARLTTSIACVPLFQEESPHPPPRMAFLGCSRSSSVVDRRVTGKTVPMTLAARTAPAVRSGKRPGKTRRGYHRGVDTYRPREAGRQKSRSEMRDTRCMSDRVTVGRASTKVARSQTPRAGRRYRHI